jgi:hypothetical protein
MSAPRSVRFDEEVLCHLERYVRSHPGTSASSVTNVFVDEALRAEEHPGIVFRPGPTGRRAGLARGPDVWEVIGALHAAREEDPSLAGEALAGAIADVTGINPQMVHVAIRYYAAYPDEVNERITANTEAAREAEAVWQAEQELLGAQDRASRVAAPVRKPGRDGIGSCHQRGLLPGDGEHR